MLTWYITSSSYQLANFVSFFPSFFILWSCDFRLFLCTIAVIYLGIEYLTNVTVGWFCFIRELGWPGGGRERLRRWSLSEVYRGRRATSSERHFRLELRHVWTHWHPCSINSSRGSSNTSNHYLRTGNHRISRYITLNFPGLENLLVLKEYCKNLGKTSCWESRQQSWWEF